jgi:precorrin-6B methylase 2
MLADPLRVGAYARAIEQTVRPGDVVVDLGCGTGILSFLAAKKGAKKVYAIEVADIADVAKQVRAANKLEKTVELIAGLSYLTVLPEKADVLITETIGDFGLDEGIVGAVLDAKVRLMRPNARLIPHWIELYAAPVEVPEIYESIRVFRSDLHGVDYSAIRAYAAGLMYQERIDPRSFVAEPQRLGRTDLRNAATAELRTKVTFTADKTATIHGMCGWFRSEIAEGIELENRPGKEETSWQQVWLPLEAPRQVSAGDVLAFSLDVLENGAQWIWRLD